VTCLEIRAGSHRYDVLIGSSLVASAGEVMKKQLRGSRCAVISDSTIAPLYAGRILESLKSAGFAPTLLIFAAGEQSKSLEQAGAICDQMTAAGLDRQSFVLGLGGGVVGDLSGFVAAIYRRAIPHVQIPTTLLAMVDSSIGGKNGVNTRDGKNLIGAVHHPALVIDDVDVLETLPRRELNQGFAEIIKHAIIADAEMFDALPKNVAQASNLRTAKDASGTPALQQLIRRNIEIKSRIVAKDEFDRTGERALLNFGHTVGHAIERAGGYQQLLHGEAVSLGIVAACAISIKKAGLSEADRDAIVDRLQAFDLPTRLPANFPREKIFAALPFDKKFEGGNVRFVVTSGIASAHLSSDVAMDDIRAAVGEL
jgi:3-dehydroquinate synthase